MSSLPFKVPAVVAVLPRPSSIQAEASLVLKLTRVLRTELEADPEITLVSEKVLNAAENNDTFPDNIEQSEIDRLEQLGVTPLGARLAGVCNVAIFIRSAYGEPGTIEISSGRPPSFVGRNTRIRAESESDIDAFSYQDRVRDDIAICLDEELFAADLKAFFEARDHRKASDD